MAENTVRTASDARYAGGDIAQISSEVEEFYRAYMKAFSARDLDAVCSTYVGFPYAEFGQDGGIVIHDEASGTHQFETAFKMFEEQGWSHTETDEVIVVPLSNNVAAVASTVTRYHHDGHELLGGKRVMYIMRRSPDGWRITGYSYVADGFPNVAVGS